MHGDGCNAEHLVKRPVSVRAVGESCGVRRLVMVPPGNHADMVIIDRNPLTCPLPDLANTRVLATLLGGQAVPGAIS